MQNVCSPELYNCAPLIVTVDMDFIFSFSYSSDQGFLPVEFVWEWKIKDVLWNPITLLRPYSTLENT